MEPFGRLDLRGTGAALSLSKLAFLSIFSNSFEDHS
jgi:hypothetical protein